MFVITLTYLKPLAEMEPHLADHRAWLDQHYASGLLLASGPQNPRIGGIILARGGGTREALAEVFRDDPFQTLGLARYDIIEFEPVKHQPALANLI